MKCGTTDAIFILRQLQEKYLETDNLYLVFVDLEKAFDRVLRVLIGSSLRRKGVVECCVKAVMRMYKEVLSQVKVEGKDSKEFAVTVGIHQGSVLSLVIFFVEMDVVTEEVVNEGCALMYADDLVLICETKEEARCIFVAWRTALKSKGLKVNISKMKVMRCAWDVAPKEAAMDPCSVSGKRVSVIPANFIAFSNMILFSSGNFFNKLCTFVL